MSNNKIKTYHYYYQKIKKVNIQYQKATNEEVKASLKRQIDETKELLAEAGLMEIDHLNKAISQDEQIIEELSAKYNELSPNREYWLEKANLVISPDGKLKTLKKTNKIGKKKSLSYGRKMIKIAEKIQKITNRINNNKVIIEAITKGTYQPLGFFAKAKKKWRSIPYEKQQRIWGYIFCFPWIVGFIVFFFLPFSTTLWWSLNTVKPDKGKLLITWAGFSNYTSLFKNYVDTTSLVFSEVLLSSLGTQIFNLIVVIIFSLIMAVFLNTKFKGNGLVKAIFFIPVIFNATAISIAMDGLGARLDSSMSANFAIARQFTVLLQNMSLPDKFTNFLVTSVNQIFTIVNMSGVQILIFLAAIQSVPTSIYEAAKIEGATKYEMFWKITFPMVTPILLTALVYTIVDAFARSPILNFIANAQSLSKYGIASSMAVIFFLINFIIIGAFYLILKSGVFYYDER